MLPGTRPVTWVRSLAIHVLLACSVLGCASSAKECVSRKIDQSIVAQVATVLSAPTDQDARNAAFALMEISAAASDKDALRVSDEAIDSIASLLQDNRNAIKLFAASALASLGPRAKRALPALRDAAAQFREEPLGTEIDFRPRDGAERLKLAITTIESGKRL
jgi:hypothetical protein